MADGKISVNFIVEMLGRPKDHLETTMGELIKKIGEEKGLNLIEHKAHDAQEVEVPKKEGKEIEVSKSLFTTFADIEAEFDTLEDLIRVAFVYMPSNIEIMDPNNIPLDRQKMGELLTSVILKMHKYDEVVKKLALENEALGNRLREMLAKEKENSEDVPEEKKNSEKENKDA